MFEYNSIFKKGLITCDYCGKEKVYTGAFLESIDKMKKNGWIIIKINLEWMHFCSKKCYENFKK